MPVPRVFSINIPSMFWPKYEAGLYPFIEDRYPAIFTELAEKQEISDDLDKQMSEALEAYDEEFKDTIK